jgi:hypothetical protein
MIVYILIFLIIAFVIWKWYTKGMIKKINNNAQFVKKLMRQAARWTTAAKQDTNPIIALLHANYGAAYIFAIKDAVPIKQIIKYFPNFEKYEREIIETQDWATKGIIKACPSLVSNPDELAQIGGEGGEPSYYN